MMEAVVYSQEVAVRCALSQRLTSCSYSQQLRCDSRCVRRALAHKLNALYLRPTKQGRQTECADVAHEYPVLAVWGNVSAPTLHWSSCCRRRCSDLAPGRLRGTSSTLCASSDPDICLDAKQWPQTAVQQPNPSLKRVCSNGTQGQRGSGVATPTSCIDRCATTWAREAFRWGASGVFTRKRPRTASAGHKVHNQRELQVTQRQWLGVFGSFTRLRVAEPVLLWLAPGARQSGAVYRRVAPRPSKRAPNRQSHQDRGSRVKRERVLTCRCLTRALQRAKRKLRMATDTSSRLCGARE
jgi:hypothetical protein